MSIDFQVLLYREFSVAKFCDKVEAIMAEVLGRECEPLVRQFWPDLEARPGRQPESALSDWQMGYGSPARWLTLSLPPHVMVDISTMSATDHGYDDDGETDFSATASWRTASSVLVATCSALAATDLGAGRFLSCDDLVVGVPEPTVERLVASLSLEGLPDDLEEASRCILLRTPRFQDWGVLR